MGYAWEDCNIMTPIGAPGILSSVSTPAFDPLTAINWEHAWWAEGPRFKARGYADNAAVATWDDEIGASNNTQATGTKQPLYKAAGGPNSRPCILPDGIDDAFTGPSFTGFGPPWSLCVIGAMKFTNLSYNYIFAAAHLNQNNNNQWSTNNNGLAIAGGTANANPHLFSVYSNQSAGTSKLTLDGTIVINPQSGMSTNPLTRLRYWFVSESGTYFNDKPLCFVGVYNGNHEMHAQWSNFKAWTMSYYGITVV
jgi:hypothetical protein